MDRKTSTRTCPFCNRKLVCGPTVRRVTTHIKRFHTEDRESDLLRNIVKEFFILSARRSVTEHNKVVHLKIKNFECDVCEKMFPYKTKLKIHKDSIHGKLKYFACVVCNFRCAQYGNQEECTSATKDAEDYI